MRGNQLLASLPTEAASALQKHLIRVRLNAGQRLICAGDWVETVHFPIDCQLANIVEMPDGSPAETSFVGAEGCSGLAPVLADRDSPWSVVVRVPGEAWVIRTEQLSAAVEESPELLQRLLVLTLFYQAQSAQYTACNMHHTVLQRLARVLLTSTDVSPEVPLRFSQEELALVVGNQRSTVNQAAQHLKSAGAIAYRRGHIEIVDRGRLEARACPCYKILRDHAERERLLPPRQTD